MCACERIVDFNESLWNYDKASQHQHNIETAHTFLRSRRLMLDYIVFVRYLFGISSFCFCFFSFLFRPLLRWCFCYFLPSITISLVSIVYTLFLFQSVLLYRSRALLDFRRFAAAACYYCYNHHFCLDFISNVSVFYFVSSSSTK